jgi:predicted ABC-type ATPase
MPSQQPVIVVIGGPNGAGKSTIATRLLVDAFSVQEFVNADSIASGLSGRSTGTAEIAAGRIMLTRMAELAQARASFSFESTLASRTFAPWLRECVRDGYEVRLVYVWLSDPDLAVSRVADRVRSGGHNIPADVVFRRYFRSINNLFELYIPIARYWHVFDNSDRVPHMVAYMAGGDLRVLDPAKWSTIRSYADSRKKA